jgi:hypothetical protein
VKAFLISSRKVVRVMFLSISAKISGNSMAPFPSASALETISRNLGPML